MPAFPTAARPAHRPARSLTWLLILLTVPAYAAAWTLLGLMSGSMLPWLSIGAALLVAAWLRLGGIQRGAGTAVAGLLCVAATCALANYAIAAMEIGGPMGFRPLDALVRMGPGLAWQLAGLANTAAGSLGYLAGVLLAAWWCS